MKKVLFCLLGLSFLLGTVNAEELAPSAKSAILIEASTGKVLYEKNADEALAPASMTKIMTLLLTMEAIDAGTISLTDMVHVSENAASMGGSQVYLDAGTEYKLEDIIKATSIASGNDAAVVLAETIGGSTDNFVSMMNKKAKDLGLTSTNFVNVYGLDADGHQSSARDMAKMARELVKYELILKYSSIYEDYLNKPDGSNIWMVNTNRLVRFYQGVDGLKTGYTENAGYCLTATGKWNDLRLISVVMGEASQNDRTNDTVALLNYGKSNYKINKIIAKGEILGKIDIELGKTKSADITSSEDVTDLIKSGEEKKEYSYEIKTYDMTAPIKKGKAVGKVRVYADKKLINETDLIVTKAIKKCSFLEEIGHIVKLILVGSGL